METHVNQKKKTNQKSSNKDYKYYCIKNKLFGLLTHIYTKTNLNYN
jgi:hypothetical protein